MTGLQITQPFDEPFSQSTAALPSYFSPSVVGIAGIPYLLDDASGRYRRESFDVVQQRNTTDARDVLLLPQDVWRQQAQSWHLGAGQSNVDRDDALPYRFKDSFGIDPWTRYQIGLLPETLRLNRTDTMAGKIWLMTHENYLVVLNDQAAYWYDELSVGSTAYVGSTVMSSGNAILDVAHRGYEVMTLTADRYVWTVSGPSGTPAKWANHQYSTNVNFIDWQKDYLLVGDGNILYNAVKANNPGTIFTHPDTDFRWQASCDGNSCIYVLGGVGDKSVVHRVNIKQDGTGLQPCIVAATLPDGEQGRFIDSYLGFILIGTDKGVRIAQAVNDSGDLTLGPIIPTSQPVYCFEGQDRFVWYGMSSMDGSYGTSEEYFPTSPICGLGRLDLSVNTVSQLTPAYANDIYTTAQSNKIVRSVVTYADKRVFSVDGGGVYFESTNKVDAGWLTQGTISYSVEDLKTGLYMQAKWLPLTGEVAFDVAYDSTGYVRVASYDVQSSIRSGNIDLDGVQFSRIDARYLLKRSSSDATLGPTMTRWEVRSVPVRGRSSRWTLPIMNYEEFEVDGVSYTRDPLLVLDTLTGLVESGVLFTLQESGRAYQVHAKEFVWEPEKVTINGRAWQGICTLIVEEVQ